ncbi:primosomal protein N', partial [bacterium]|nr:primosomal protein N' [bacterium]
MIASVLVFRGVESLYSYRIPNELADHIRPGTPVTVPFGAVQNVKGIVLGIAEPESDIKMLPLKPISGICDQVAPLSNEQIDLLNWFRNYYLCSPYKALQTVAGTHLPRNVTEPPASGGNDAQFDLTKEQQDAVDKIQSLTGFLEVLIHGVTASGKTELYIRLAQNLQAQGKGIVILVPEIALTPQFSRIFQHRVGSAVAVLHSGLTPKQRAEAQARISAGIVSVVIGPRSAIFSPVRNLGMIIVDECHESAYKQDQHPRYSALSVAEYRARYHNIPLVLGSATPSIEQYYHAHGPHGTYIRLKTRVAGRPMPEMEISDMRDSAHFPDDSIVGIPLLRAIRTALTRGEKSMILVNRRGYAPTVGCKKCKNPVACPQCELPYTYHQDRVLRCHRCFTHFPLPKICPSCGKGTLEISGVAIQKVELALRKLFPSAAILRLDRDTATTARQIETILDEFRTAGDILIGTQMIAKGHDIPEVTVVGMVGTDSALGIPDFRASERCFQLITQVSGRAGRGEKPGIVFIQTTKPTHYAVQAACSSDYEGFYKNEVQFRKQLRYPPFVHLVNIILSGKHRPKVHEAA